jgi:hypothetical protein
MRPLLPLAALALLVSPAALSALASAPGDLLPTLAPQAGVLGDLDLVKDPNSGAVLLRFANAIANTGQGPLLVVGHRESASPKTVDPDRDTMPAFQRILQSDGTWREVPVGTLTYHPAHHHFHFDGAARYRLLAPDGTVLAESPKVSFCLADVQVVDGSLPGFKKSPTYNSCAHDPYATDLQMGVSVGWEDIYGKDLIGQAFDVSALMQQAPQWYTLESTTNPQGLLLEGHQASPAHASVQVWIGDGVKLGVGKSRPGV